MVVIKRFLGLQPPLPGQSYYKLAINFWARPTEIPYPQINLLSKICKVSFFIIEIFYITARAHLYQFIKKNCLNLQKIKLLHNNIDHFAFRQILITIDLILSSDLFQ